MAQVARSSKGCRSPFHSIKFFVFCHGLLQLALLLVSGYLKSSINTIERRYGFSSKKSGMLSSFNEVGSTFLIVFVSFFGSRVHRPRFIGMGALIASAASAIMALPHFLGGLYKFTDHIAITSANNSSGLCQTENAVSTLFSDPSCTEEESTAEQWIYPILLTGQLLLGVGTVPIHPFGISYIDDFASKKTSPLYLGILLAVTCIGPAFGFIMGGFMLRFYVDIDKLSKDEIRLDPKDQRWVGAWWLGFLVTSIFLFIAAIPYMFFPSRMPKEDDGEDNELRTENATEPKKEQTLTQFLKSFPRIAMRTFRSPVYLLVVFSQVFMAALVVGVATFMAKFIERQFSLSFSIANMMIGGVVIPLAVLGIVLGGVVMRRLNLSVNGASRMCCIVVTMSIFSAIPLLLIGCPTQKVAGVFPPSQDTLQCNKGCACNIEAFNPICGSDGIEFRSPCHAGCLAMKLDNTSTKVTNYTECACVGREAGVPGTAVPGTCGTMCSHLLLPFLVLAATTCFAASFSQTPSFMMILRTVDPEDKSFAVGVQYMLFRVLAFLPGPVLYGTVIDSACILWGGKCGKTTACLYYNMDHFRQRFFGVQAIFICAGLFCFLMVMTVLRKQTKKQSQDTGKEYELVNGENKRRESEVSSRQRPSLTT